MPDTMTPREVTEFASEMYQRIKMACNTVQETIAIMQIMDTLMRLEAANNG